MKWVFLVVSAAAAAGAFSYRHLLQEEWNAFKLKYNKHYASAEEDRERMEVYVAEKLKVALHNERYSLGQTSFKLGLNEFSDRFPSEIQRMHGYIRNKNTAKFRGSNFISPAKVEFPRYVNWTAKGAVTQVKKQGNCGSCWSFSSTGALEGQVFRKTGKLVSLSEQNLIDCSGSFGNYGCDGGSAHNAYNYIYYNRGIDTEKSYPYEGVSYLCRYNPENSAATDQGFVEILSGDEGKLKAAVATVGPIVVAIQALDTFSKYKGGIYYDPRCTSSADALNHQVLVVGYGTDRKGGDYWLIKNSWGESWGIGGYMMMARNQNNHCGIATDAIYPVV